MKGIGELAGAVATIGRAVRGEGALAEALAVSDVRQEKVEALRRAIAEGSYSVSAADLADKLMSVMLRP